MTSRAFNFLAALAAILLFSFAALTARADTGLYFNQQEDGEGFSITEQGDNLAFLFFTYAKPPVDERPRLPTVSPAPPPPVVPADNSPLWVIGNTTLGFGEAGFWLGDVSYAIYDEEQEGRIARFVKVGEFEVEKFVGTIFDGYNIRIEWVENDYFGPTSPLYVTNYTVQLLFD